MNAARLIVVVVALALGTLQTGCGIPPRLTVTPKYAVEDAEFLNTMDGLLRAGFVRGNRVTPLFNGDEFYPPMLQAIASAQQTVTFETFIYWSGEIGDRFVDALCERAQAGVKVHVIVDAVGGGRMKSDYFRRMEEAGVEVARYHKLRWYDLTTAARLNYRTHRKLLIVDGRIGFTGGAGIADVWLPGGALESDGRQWRDNHYQVEGPVVASLQSAFIDNWVQATGHMLHGAEYFPPLSPAGDQLAQVVISSPEGGGSGLVQQMYLLSIAAARSSILLATPYFVPDQTTHDAILEARNRGVNISILVPGERIDVEVARAASRSAWGPLLQAGVRIYEYEPTMYHNKLMIVDGLWVSIGSSNLDNRSFKLNDEANLNVYDAGLAAILTESFEADVKRAREVTREDWEKAPLIERILEHAASLISGQL